MRLEIKISFESKKMQRISYEDRKREREIERKKRRKGESIHTLLITRKHIFPTRIASFVLSARADSIEVL